LPFGFHGLFNFYRVMSPEELATLVREFPPAIARSSQFTILGRNCLALGLWQAAAAVFKRILEELPNNATANAGLAKAEANAVMQPAESRKQTMPMRERKALQALPRCGPVIKSISNRGA
jgi:hypothetical protein